MSTNIEVDMKDDGDDDEDKLNYNDFLADCRDHKSCYVEPHFWLKRLDDIPMKMKIASLEQEWDKLSKPLQNADSVLVKAGRKTLNEWFKLFDYVFEKWKFTETRIKQEADKLYEQRRAGTYELDKDLKEEDSTNQLTLINLRINGYRSKIQIHQATAKENHRYNEQVKINLAKLSDLIDELETLKTKSLKDTQWRLAQKEIQYECMNIVYHLDDLADDGVYAKKEGSIVYWNGPWAVAKSYQFSLEEWYGFTHYESNFIFRLEKMNDDIRKVAEEAQQRDTFTNHLEDMLAELDALLEPDKEFIQHKHTINEWTNFSLFTLTSTQQQFQEPYQKAQALVVEGNQMEVSGKLSSKDDDDGSLAWFMQKQCSVSGKGGGGPKRIMIDDEEDEKNNNNSDSEATQDEEEFTTTSDASKSPEKQKLEEEEEKKHSLLTSVRKLNEKEIQGSSQLPTMFQTDPELLQREYYYSDDENYNARSKKDVKPVNVDQLMVEVKNLEPNSNFHITEHASLSTLQVVTVRKIKQLFHEAKFSDYTKTMILTPPICKMLIFLVRVAPRLAQMSEEVKQQYPGLLTRLNNYLQWSYGIMVNLNSSSSLLMNKVQTELFTKEEHPTEEQIRDRFWENGILEAFKAKRILRSWLEEIPKLYRFSMQQIETLLQEIQANNKNIKLTKAAQIRAQYRELRLYEADTIARIGNNFDEADDVNKHREEIYALSVVKLLPKSIQEEYEETLGGDDSWAEDVSIVEYDYQTDGLSIYNFNRFWTPFPEEIIMESGLLNFLSSLWEIQKDIGPAPIHPTASQIFESVAIPAANDFLLTYNKVLETEDVYNQVKKDITKNSMAVAIENLLNRVHERAGNSSDTSIPLSWLRPVVNVYISRFVDRISLDAGKATGTGISDAEGMRMLEELFYVDAYLNTIYRRFALVLFPRLLREIALDERAAKKEAAKDKIRLAKNFGYQEQLAREILQAAKETAARNEFGNFNEPHSILDDIKIQEEAAIRSLDVFIQEEESESVMNENNNKKDLLKPGEMYRKHALRVVRELYDTAASVELSKLIDVQREMIETAPDRYEYWYKQTRAHKDSDLVEAVEQDRKQVIIVAAGWKDKIGNPNDRLLGFLMHTFELSEGSNTLRKETMEEIIRDFFALYKQVKQFEDGFQETLQEIMKQNIYQKFKKVMRNSSFADNKDRKLFKAYQKEINRKNLVKSEQNGGDDEDDMKDEEQKTTTSNIPSVSRVNELQARIANAASTLAQQLEDLLDSPILKDYQTKTGLQQVISQFRGWRKDTTETETEKVASFKHYLTEFKNVIDLKKSKLKDLNPALTKLQNTQQDLEATLQLMIDSNEPETKQKPVKSEIKRIYTEIISLQSNEVIERILQFEKKFKPIYRNFYASEAYLTQHPDELSWATVYAALGLASSEGGGEQEVEEEEVKINIPKRTVSNKIEKSEIDIHDTERKADEIDDDDELEIEYVKYGIQLSELAPHNRVKAEPNSFHALDEVKTDDVEITSSNIVSSYKPMTIEGKKAKLIVSSLTVSQQRYDQMNEVNKPDFNEYRAMRLEDDLFNWHSMGMENDEDISPDEARSRAKQDVLQYMQSNHHIPMAIEESKETAVIPVKQEFVNRKRPAADEQTTTNNNNINNNNINNIIDFCNIPLDAMPLPMTLTSDTMIRVETNDNNQGYKVVPFSETKQQQQEPKRQRIPKIAATNNNNNNNVKVVRKPKIPILQYIYPAPLEKVNNNNDQMDTGGFFSQHEQHERKDPEEQEIYSLVRASMFTLRRTPLGVSMLEDIFDGPINVPEEFDVILGQEFKQGIVEECKYITSTLIQCKICLEQNLWQALIANRNQIEQTFDLILTESYNRNNEPEFEIPYTFWSKRHSNNNFKDLTQLERQIRKVYADYFIIFAFNDFEAERLSGMKTNDYTQYKNAIFQGITELEQTLNAEGKHTGLQILNEIPFTSFVYKTLAQQLQQEQHMDITDLTSSTVFSSS